MMKLLALIFAILFLHNSAFAWKLWGKHAKKIIAGSLVSQAFLAYPAIAEPMPIAPTLQNQLNELEKTKGVVIPVQTLSLQDQIKELQNQKNLMQKEMLAKSEDAAMTRQLTYPEGKLIARGVVSLEVKPGCEFGFYEASEMDPAYGGDASTVFILGVGREGPPLAAKRFKLKDVKFPLSFELTTDDLLFPYTESAWMSSDFKKDTIATTAIISAGNAISVPTQTERYGFGLSDPTTFAGQLTRSSSKMNVVGKVDGTLYTPDDVKLLSSIDAALDSREATSQTATKK